MEIFSRAWFVPLRNELIGIRAEKCFGQVTKTVS